MSRSSRSETPAAAMLAIDLQCGIAGYRPPRHLLFRQVPNLFSLAVILPAPRLAPAIQQTFDPVSFHGGPPRRVLTLR